MQPAGVLTTEFPSLTEPTPAFLVACLRGRRQAEALEQARALAATPAFDWAAVDEAARRELLAPLLYRILQGRGILPASIEDAWRGLYAGSLQRNRLLLGELDAVLHDLANAGSAPAGSAPILLKGAALVRTVYEDAGMRPMNDIDLLLRHADVPVALHRLAGLGYAVAEPFAYFGEVAAHRQGRLTADVDVHWSLIGLPHYQALIPPTWPWATARPLEGGAEPALVLGPEAQLLQLCAHLVLQHRHQALRLLWLHDVAEVLYAHAADVDWAGLLAAAQAYDLVLPLQRILPFVSAAWQAPAPGPVLAELAVLQPSPAAVQLYRWLDGTSASAAPASPEELSWAELAAMSGRRARLAFLRAHLLPPVAYMRQRYQARSPFALLLTYPRRWVSGLSAVPWLARRLFARRPPR